MSNILEVIGADKNLATLYKIIGAAGLEIELGNAGPFTIFAPSDTAFGQLAGGQLGAFIKPEIKARLYNIIRNHIVKGKKRLSDFQDGQKLQTLNGSELEVTIANGLVFISGSAVQGKNVEASNGIVHLVDKIMMPAIPAVQY